MTGTIGTAIILVIIGVLIVVAIIYTVKHFRGESGCCGGECSSCNLKVEPEKKLTGEIIAEKIVHIEGMHCDNCKNCIERSVNRIDGDKH